MFETEAKKLIKQSARFLIDRDDYDIHEQAEKIQKICGQRLIFQFRLNDYNFKYGYQDYTVHRIFFIDPEEDSAVQHANVEQLSCFCRTLRRALKRLGLGTHVALYILMKNQKRIARRKMNANSRNLASK
uniref:Uncharacterized protein n=1 Tax=Aegilops tauschii subsp. strangulata TaxID=200361 RepID=A0A453BIC4_AEGTS